jgi:glycosyltransferase involved in cell wall biosynthesis
MRVILASTIEPFVEGGSTFIVDWLEATLQAAGHEVETLRIPYSTVYKEQPEQMLALRLLDVSQHGDRLIAIRPPSYLLRHPSKVIWFIHHYRGAYDLWGTRYQDIPNTPEGSRYRDMIHGADQLAFGEARAIFSNSQVVARRLKEFNQVNAEVLYPPLFQPERFRTSGYGDYLLYFSRLTHHKRQWLAIEAMRHTCTPVRLLIAGRADPGSEPYLAELRKAVETHRLGDRVSILSDWIAESEKVELFASCLAATYFPFDEDSYGYPALEAHHSRKAVVTTTDSGGTVELIADGLNGLVTSPEPKCIARAMDDLYRDRDLARVMGENGLNRVRDMNISWNRVLERLLA